jgi:glycosyltransferase involved in cell wall biosynthesis
VADEGSRPDGQQTRTASRLLHFALDSDTSGYFPQLARWRRPDRVQMAFGTLRPTDPALVAALGAHGVPVYCCEARSRWAYPLAVARLYRHLRSSGIEVMHAHLFDPSVVGLVAAALARTPLRVQTRHYSDYHTRIGRRWHRRLDQLCTRLSHAVIAVSQHTADHLIGVEGAPRHKVHVIHNGIDFDRVRASPEGAAQIRATFLEPGQLLLVTVGRLHPEKGYEYLFKAMAAAIPRIHPGTRLLIAGRGPFEDAYRKMVHDLGLDEQVRFLGFRDDVPDLVSAADLFVLPSVAEAFGLAVAEALYLGTPVLATQCGGIPEIVVHDRDGVLVPPGDVAPLAQALVGLLNDPARLASLRFAGTARIRERFSFERMVAAYEALYARLLS